MSMEDVRALAAQQQQIMAAQQQQIMEQQQQEPMSPQEQVLAQEADNQYRQAIMQRQQQDHGVNQYSERFLNRMVSINLPDPSERVGNWFMNHAEFIEVLTLLNLDHTAHRQIHRDFLEIEDLATGSSNRLLVEAKQRELLFDLLCYKSRSDFGDEKSLRERSMWMTSRSQSTSDIRMPQEQAQSRGGFLSTFLGRR